MFKVVEREDAAGAFEVRGSGQSVGQVALFVGPRTRVRAEAYAQWLNTKSTRPKWHRQQTPRREPAADR